MRHGLVQTEGILGSDVEFEFSLMYSEELFNSLKEILMSVFF